MSKVTYMVTVVPVEDTDRLIVEIWCGDMKEILKECVTEEYVPGVIAYMVSELREVQRQKDIAECNQMLAEIEPFDMEES